MKLWDLPGARRFIDSTCDLLRGGSSVVVQFPTVVPDGFHNSVITNLGNALRVSHVPATCVPLQDLAKRYAEQPDQIRRLRDLCDDAGFRGRLVVPQGLDANNWPVWRGFLGTYAQASRSQSLLGRSLFLVTLPGPSPAEPPPKDVGLDSRAWDGVLDDVDLLLFSTEHLRQRSSDPLVRSLLATTIARVAAWDFETAAALVAANDSTIMDPGELLRTLAQERSWTIDTPIDWHLGTASRAGVVHPARAALDNPPAELHRRLWSAQLSVLLPWIEARRYEIVADNMFEVKRQMRFDGNGQEDPFALELGDLFRLFVRRGANRHIRKTVGNLREVRNELAHHRHVEYATVRKLIA